MTESTKTYVVTFQHENWEDDGGDHDAFIVVVPESIGKRLEEVELLPMSCVEDDEDRAEPDADLVEALTTYRMPAPYSLPIFIDGVLNIWHR